MHVLSYPYMHNKTRKAILTLLADLLTASTGGFLAGFATMLSLRGRLEIRPIGTTNLLSCECVQAEEVFARVDMPAWASF